MALLPAEAPPAHGPVAESVAELAPRLAGVVPRGLRRRSDERLLRAARLGDERAIEVLCERHAPAILRYCRSLLRSGQEAEDVRQEVFVLAISALRRGAEPRAFRPWLYRIAHNACVSHQRVRRPVLVADNGVLVDRHVSTEPVDGHREELRQLLDDIAALPDVQRGALLLREMDGFSYEQVGEVLGVPQSTVRASIFRARRTLQGLAEARDADCEAIQAELCALADRRGRRNRRITAHLRVCSSCRTFRDELRRRPAMLGATPAPALALGPLGPLAAIVALKGKLFGGASAGAGAGAVVATGGGAKVAAVASTCALLAAGGVEAERYLHADRGPHPAPATRTAEERSDRAAERPPASAAAPATAAVAPAAIVPAVVAPAAPGATRTASDAGARRVVAGAPERQAGTPAPERRRRGTPAAPSAPGTAPSGTAPEAHAPDVARAPRNSPGRDDTTTRAWTRPRMTPPIMERDDAEPGPGRGPGASEPETRDPESTVPAAPAEPHAPAPRDEDDETPAGASGGSTTPTATAPEPAKTPAQTTTTASPEPPGATVESPGDAAATPPAEAPAAPSGAAGPGASSR